jgi:hypothetical protein
MMITEVDEREQLKQKLLSRIIKQDGPLDTPCWIWTWGQSSGGYGKIRWKGVSEFAHRLSYSTFVGPIPAGLHCLHRCHVPLCICPDHLYTGTDQDNVNDRTNSGRHWVPPHFGEASGRALLTEAKASEILFLALEGHLMQGEIANHYGVSRPLVSLIRSGKCWPHVQP